MGVTQLALERAKEQGRKFDLKFENASYSEFDAALDASWKALGADQELQDWRDAVGRQPERSTTTADSENRKKDKAEFEGGDLAVVESGEADVELIASNGLLIANGYKACLYGDHGPYFELGRQNVHWPAFVHHMLKGPGRHYHEHYFADRSVKIYDQFNGVGDEPNPPPGDRAVHNNRPEGYADYRSGRIYLAMENVNKIVRSRKRAREE